MVMRDKFRDRAPEIRFQGNAATLGRRSELSILSKSRLRLGARTSFRQ
jgi:hypothetical protein